LRSFVSFAVKRLTFDHPITCDHLITRLILSPCLCVSVVGFEFPTPI
jgi:hypothetical protein